MEQPTLDHLISVLDNPFEDRHVDMKCPEKWDEIKYKLARCALAMANLVVDGLIIVGVEELENGGFVRHGLTSDQSNSFKSDDVRDLIGSFMDPTVDLESGHFEHDSKKYFGIRVGFSNTRPVIAAKGNIGPGQDEIEKGQIYVRPVGVKPQSRKATPKDIERLIEDHVDARLKKQLAMLQSLNLLSGTTPGSAIPVDVYEKERGDF